MKNEFETLIDRLIEKINTFGYGVGYKNHPRRLHSGKYIEGELFDYTIILNNGNILCFDAKAIHSDKWKVLDKDINQLNNLLKIKNPYVKCFFLVYFYPLKTYKIIMADKLALLLQTTKTIKHEEFEVLDLVKELIFC